MRDSSAIQYRVLGPITVEDSTGNLSLGGPKQRLVLALLLVEPGRTVHVERLIDGVWEDDPPSGAVHTMQTYVSELRRVLPDAVTFESGGYRLHADETRIDAQRFRSLAESGGQAMPSSPGEASASLREALALWRGQPFADLAYAEALQSEIARLEATRTSVLENRVEADLALGRHKSLVDELQALTREHPFHERFWAQLMLALYRSGRRAEAIAAFERARRVLAEELDADPSQELLELMRRIDASDRGLMLDPVDAAGRPASPPAVRGFELRERVGGGRHGKVFAAYQASLAREVAVKVIDPALVNDPSFVRHFDTITQRVARLEHPNIVPLLDAWRDPDGAYLVTPLLSGGDLERSLSTGAWEITAAIRIVEQVGAALAYAHRMGLVHGDLDATDVLLDAGGNAFVSDLGLHEVLERVRSTSAEPQPERDAGAADTNVDVASLGVIAYRLLTGLPEADIARTDLSRLRPEVPAGVGQLIESSTARGSDDAPADVGAFLRTLRRALGIDAVAPDLGDESADDIRDPYMGLRAFAEQDAADFFGRDAAIELALERMRKHRLVAVVGSSGCGKSSLVRAGIIPALRSGALPGSGAWVVSVITPGAFPFEELGRALREVAVADDDDALQALISSDDGLGELAHRLLPPDTDLILLVDQLEELFSMVHDAGVRGRFLASLTAATRGVDSRVRVVVTARADYFDRFLDDPAFGGPMRDGLVALSQPSAEELMLAIQAPAARAGLRLDPGLTERIVTDVYGRPAALPLMQHALTELVRRREGSLLTLQAYEAAGGALGAVGNRAEQVYAGLGTTARSTVRDAFMRLIAIDDDGGPVRRRVNLAELHDLGLDRRLLEDVLDAFGAFRLLTFDRDPVSRGPTVEVAHEAIFSQWTRLADWIDDQRQHLLTQRRLASTMAEWRAANREPSYLLGGGRLLYFERWASEADLPLSHDEREYIAASRAREDAADARVTRRRRLAFGALSVATFLVTALVLFGWITRETAEHERAVASVLELLRGSDRAAERESDLGILLAAEAVKAARSLEPELLASAEARLHQAIAEDRIVLTLHGDGEVAWSPDGARLAYYTSLPGDEQPEGILVVDPATGEQVTPFLPTLEGSIPWDLTWSPDGDHIAATYQPIDVDAMAPPGPIIWDVRTGSRVASLPGTGDVLTGPSYSPDGQSLAAVDLSGTMTVWERGAVAETPGSTRSTPSTTPTLGRWGVKYRVPVVASALPEFDPSGDLIAVAADIDDEMTVLLLDAETGQERRRFPPLESGVLDFSWSPDGQRVATLTSDGAATIWELDGAADPVVITPDNQSNEIDWHPLGNTIAFAGRDGSVTVWDAGRGSLEDSLHGHTNPVTGLEWSPDGRLLATAGGQGPVHVWEPQGGGVEIASFETDGVGMLRVRWSNDEALVLAHGGDGAVRVWRAEGGEPIATLPDQQLEGPFGIPLSPDGTRAAIGGPGYSTVLVELETLHEQWSRPAGGVPGSFSSDGRFITTGYEDAARVLDAETGKTVKEYRPAQGPPTFFFAARFLSGDRWVLLVDPGSVPRLWDWRTDEVVELDYRPGTMGLVSQDGRRFAVGREGEPGARVWDATDFLAGRTETPAIIQSDLPMPSNAVLLGFTPDGEQLVTGLDDEQATFWDLHTGEAVRSVPHVSRVSGAQVSADGRRLLLGWLPRVYTLDTDELLDIAEDRVSRRLTDAECRQYLQRDGCPLDP